MFFMYSLLIYICTYVRSALIFLYTTSKYVNLASLYLFILKPIEETDRHRKFFFIPSFSVTQHSSLWKLIARFENSSLLNRRIYFFCLRH